LNIIVLGKRIGDIVAYQLYEIWTEDESGHQEFIETTGDHRQALRIAEKAKEPGITVVIYQETEDGDLEKIEEL
jgi:hypothetical protein